jgi:hypothetical protein
LTANGGFKTVSTIRQKALGTISTVFFFCFFFHLSLSLSLSDLFDLCFSTTVCRLVAKQTEARRFSNQFEFQSINQIEAKQNNRIKLNAKVTIFDFFEASHVVRQLVRLETDSRLVRRGKTSSPSSAVSLDRFFVLGAHR